MAPVNFVTRLVSRPQLLNRLSRNLSTTGELFGGCGCRQTREDCPPKTCDTKVTKARRKCKPMESFQSGQHHADGKLPEFCSKTALAEFSWKMQELQKNWDSIAAQMEKDCEARGFTKEKDHKQKSPCAVKPPVKEDHGKSGVAIFVVLGALAVAAAIAYYLYTEYKKKEEGGDKEGDEKKDETKDGKKDDTKGQ